MKQLLKYVFKHKLLLFIGFISMLSVIIIDNIIPYLQKIIVDDAILEKNFSLLTTLLVVIGISTLIKVVFGYLKEFLFDKMSANVHRELRSDVFSHIQTFEFSYFDNMNTGEIMSRLSEDVETIWETLSYGFRLFIENGIFLISSSIILFIINFKLALICVLLMIPLCFITLTLEKKFGESYSKISDQTAELNTTAQENIAGVRLIKAFAREKHEILKFLKMNKTYCDLNMEQAKITGKYFPPIEFISNMALVAITVIGGFFVIHGDMSLGDLVAFSAYIWNLIWPMRMMGFLVDILSRNSASCKKIIEILNRKTKIDVNSGSFKPDDIKGDIEFKNVSFKYNDEIILKDINLKIPSGSTVAIMGTTGSGKSSLINLIGRYYDVFEGEVLVDNINVKEHNLTNLRSKMSIVPQDTFLFSDSIENNIKFSKSDATNDEIILACNTACAMEFINEIDGGFETLVGERGIGLSGGQKQRLCIARALVRNSSILILDDATSALDMDTEYNLLKNLESSKDNRTTFLIAHRISAVKNADIIIYMENGEIVESGTHNELLNLKGTYYNIYKEQFKDLDLM